MELGDHIDKPLTLNGFDTSGAVGRAKRTGPVLCCEGSKEGCRSHGRRRGVYHGWEESPVPRLGEPLPHTPLLHVPVPSKLSSIDMPTCKRCKNMSLDRKSNLDWGNRRNISLTARPLVVDKDLPSSPLYLNPLSLCHSCIFHVCNYELTMMCLHRSTSSL